jgi:flagellin
MMAINANWQLNAAYNSLAKSTERLSSGLRVNSAVDDAAGFAIRELMRADIDVINQGIRNAADAISMIQTAEGALSVIDEKLIRMKELAEQAATGVYTTAQRELINSEYQAMAAEIDRIANATDFNGVKLIDGSLQNLHLSSGMKIHFGTGNNRAEDYYFINIGDMRATYSSGLRVGNSDAREIWRTTALNATNPSQPLSQSARQGDRDSGVFGLQYTKGVDAAGNPMPDGSAGVWQLYGYVAIDPVNDKISDLVERINRGAQASASFAISGAAAITDFYGREVNIGDQTFRFDNSIPFSTSIYHGANAPTSIGLAGITETTAAIKALAVMLNSHHTESGVFATMNGNAMQMVSTQFGESGNNIAIYSNATSIIASSNTLKGGGAQIMTASLWFDDAAQEYELQLNMNQGGERFQMRIFNLTSQASAGMVIGDPLASVGYAGYLPLSINNNLDHIASYGATNDDDEWLEAQNGSGRTDWNGADIKTQSAAQKALAALDAAIMTKDIRRAELGAYANRLENTITSLQIQAENLQTAESRISDIDVAVEMINYSRHKILTEVATSMLAQANAFPQKALDILGK